MRNTLVEKKEGCLGLFWDPNNPRMAKVGQEQTLVYTGRNDLDFGPFNLDPVAREARRHDDLVELAKKSQGLKDKTKDELVEELMKTDYGKAEGRNSLMGRLVRDLQKKARGIGINAKKMVTHRKRPGWEKNGKGILQVLWERGFIDETKLSLYKLLAKDKDGVIIPEYSLIHLMETCTDFANEVSQLEHVCERIGAKALITTKFHAEMAGEGIEYAWGFSKALYRRYPLSIKKGKENFDKLVTKCLSRDTITRDIVRKFSARARRYMVTYQSLDMMKKDGTDPLGEGHQISHQRIENMMKMIKSHRAALDFDKEFIMKSVKASNFDFKEKVELADKRKIAGIKRKR